MFLSFLEGSKENGGKGRCRNEVVNEIVAQLFRTNAFSANTFSLNVLPSFTAIYSQSIVNTNNFFT